MEDIKSIGDPTLNIGKDGVDGPWAQSEELQSNEQKVLEDVYECIGSDQVSNKEKSSQRNG